MKTFFDDELTDCEIRNGEFWKVCPIYIDGIGETAALVLKADTKKMSISVGLKLGTTYLDSCADPFMDTSNIPTVGNRLANRLLSEERLAKMIELYQDGIVLSEDYIKAAQEALDGKRKRLDFLKSLRASNLAKT